MSKKERIKKLISYSFVPLDYVQDIQILYDNETHKEPLWLMTIAFTYGIMVGKQQDRARRKGGASA